MNERRQSLKVNHPFQDRFLLEIVVLIFIIINFLLALVLYLKTADGIGDLTLSLTLTLGLVEFAALGLLYWYLLRSSHRIAGPVYAMQTRLKALRHGDLTVALKFRKNDYFQDTSESFNECVGDMRSRVIGMRHTLDALREATTEGTEPAKLAAQLEQEFHYFRTE